MFHIKNLTFMYPNNKENTLQGMNFQINNQEIFGLLGPSGVGKSTTQKILIRLLGGYGGEVLFKGKDLSSYDRSYYQKIGVGFEMPVHFSKLTANENLHFFKQLYQDHANTDDLLKMVGLYQDRDKLVAEYSKGMKVRLNFVRALLNKPSILFLDEPTNGLDPKNARIVKDSIMDFKEKGGTVLLSTHLMNDVDELCDRVAFMANGKIVEIETPKNLKLKYGQRIVVVEYTDNHELKEAAFNLDTFGRDEKFLSIIKNNRVITIHSKETSLDDIFIKLTGADEDE